MIATTRLSVASFSQSMSLPSNGSMARAALGFFQGSENSGDWANTAFAADGNAAAIMIPRINLANFINVTNQRLSIPHAILSRPLMESRANNLTVSNVLEIIPLG